MLNLKDDSIDNSINNNQMSDSGNVYTFYPNDKCTTVAYNDTVNCGSSEASLVKNPQNLIWCKFNISNRKMLNEPFAGIEIWLKDTKDVINISNYNYIELKMIVLNRDSSNGQFTLHCHTRLKHPEYLRGRDTLPCDHPLKEPNSRYNYSVKYTEIPVQKNELIYTININSLKVPTWYFNNGVTYVEDFDKEQFFSLCIQTGSNFPLNKEYNVIISSVCLKKNIPPQPNETSSSVHKNHQLIIALLLISCILYVLVIALLIRLKPKSKTGKSVNEQSIIPSASPANAQPPQTQSSKADSNSNSSNIVSTDTTIVIIDPNRVVPETTSITKRPTPFPLDDITINVLRKIAENPRLSTDDLARDNNRDSSTICKRIERDFGKGITISKLRLYFAALDIRNKHPDMDYNEIHLHANRVITDAHGKLIAFEELQDISAILHKKCPDKMLDFFKEKYGVIHF
jgi:hypothetical protein